MQASKSCLAYSAAESARMPACGATCAILLHCVLSAPTQSSTTTPALDPHRIEIGIVPGIALDSALGLGLANLVNLARFTPDYGPYAWRLTALAQVFLARNEAGSIAPTFQLYRAQYDAPRFSEGLRLSADLSVSRLINSGYYGLGNASSAINPAESGTYFEYDRITPLARAIARMPAGDEFEVFAGGTVAWNWVNLFAGSLLEVEDSASGVLGAQGHGRGELLAGLLYEDRDDEISPARGGFHEISARIGRLTGAPGLYGGANLTLRQFLPLVDHRLVLAGRLMADLLFGHVPLYELARFSGLQAGAGPAGPLAIRGPRAQRYHGKIKVLANLELRAEVLRFQLFGLPTAVGLVGFFDTGRVWAGWDSRPDLDGTGLGLKYATGGGFRYQWGHAFVVRGDLGWSPDGLLFSVDAGHIF